MSHHQSPNWKPLSDDASDDEHRDPSELREIGKLAVWSVSSSKPGNGVELLRDDDLRTYWQSDGTQPHYVNIQFQKKVKIRQISFYVNFKQDESYTPHNVAIRVGNSFQDAQEIRNVELLEPVGWVHIPLKNKARNEDLRAFFCQIVILSNYQNGRDTHIRQVVIYGPKKSDALKLVGLPEFSSLEFKMYSEIR